jgi:putative hydrolase of the HAD superfamily
MNNIKAISFDLWGTLIISNPEFKYNQKHLVKKLNVLEDVNLWEKKIIEEKFKYNSLVETKGLHFDRKIIYRNVFNKITEDQIEEFIVKSDELFLEFPPLIKDNSFEIIKHLHSLGIKTYISSNTVLIYSNILLKIVKDFFNITEIDCHFSDKIGVSKPNIKMFDFINKPIYHIGDNLITDGASINCGINFYHISKNQNFKTFIEHANL